MKYKDQLKYFSPPFIINGLETMRNNFVFKKYKHVIKRNESLKNSFMTRRVFLLGSGPSIKNHDLSVLKNEPVIALNNFFVHPQFVDIMENGDGKFYLTAPIHPPQDEMTWQKWFKAMEEKTPQNVTMIFGLDKYSGNSKVLHDKYSLFENHRKFYYFSGIPTKSFYSLKYKHLDFTKMIWQANTVGIYALIFAMYLGFKQIYLLGFDHNYLCIKKEKDFRFYENAIHQKDEAKKFIELYGRTQNQMEVEGLSQTFNLYAMIRKNKKDISIVNLNPSSVLDIFPYQDLTSLKFD